MSTEEDEPIDAEVLFRHVREQTGITRSAFRRMVRRMVRKGMSRITFIEGRASLLLTTAGKERLIEQRD